jgi:hypothetical protein
MHPALQDIRATGSRSVLAVCGFRLSARLDFSTPSCSPSGGYPAFRCSAPQPSAEGTSNPLFMRYPAQLQTSAAHNRWNLQENRPTADSIAPLMAG